MHAGGPPLSVYMLSPRNLATSLILMPVAPLGIKLGYWLLHKLSDELVYRILYLSLLILGIKMILDGL